MITPDPPAFDEIHAFDEKGNAAPVIGVVFLTLVEADDYACRRLRDRKRRTWRMSATVDVYAWKFGEERGVAVSADEYRDRYLRWRPMHQCYPLASDTPPE